MKETSELIEGLGVGVVGDVVVVAVVVVETGGAGVVVVAVELVVVVRGAVDGVFVGFVVVLAPGARFFGRLSRATLTIARARVETTARLALDGVAVELLGRARLF